MDTIFNQDFFTKIKNKYEAAVDAKSALNEQNRLEFEKKIKESITASANSTSSSLTIVVPYNCELLIDGIIQDLKDAGFAAELVNNLGNSKAIKISGWGV